MDDTNLQDSSAVEGFTGLKFPKDKIEYALFEGYEQEGPFKGDWTLFVVGDVPVDTIIELVDQNEYSQVYFGAGGRFDYNKKTVIAVDRFITHQDYYSKTTITIEDPSIDEELLKLDTTYWMCPIMWHGQVVHHGMTSIALLSDLDARDKVMAKIDTGNEVLVAWVRLLNRNEYRNGYSADRLLLQKERE